MNYSGTILMQRPAISAVLPTILLRNVQANNNKSRDLHVTNNSKNFTIATDLRNIENQDPMLLRLRPIIMITTIEVKIIIIIILPWMIFLRKNLTLLILH